MKQPPRRIPRATYRLQLHAGFGFADAARALPYLAGLGISHVYCSPILMARPGSTHGYDVVDPTRLNPELGTLDDFARFGQALVHHGLGLILDIVPNHMGVDSAANPWWQDVLRLGPASPLAPWFDIDWTAGGGRLLLPILGADLDTLIASGDVALVLDPDGQALALACYERRLPVNAAGLALVQARATAPGGTAAGAAATGASAAPATAAGAGRPPLEALLGDPGLVRDVADLQHYELAPWQEAARRINYRRFFDIAGLAALRMDKPEVFAATHDLILAWVRAGLVDGLRVDHPDGLLDPGGYFQRLQQAAADDGGRLYVVVEKILAPGEALPRDWPVDGTTGYDFANLVCGLLVDETSLPALDATWRTFTGEATASFADLAWDCRRDVLATAFAGEWRALARRMAELADRSAPAGPDPDPADPADCAEVIAALMAAFPVYRTYPASDHGEADRRAVEAARVVAGRRLAAGDQARLLPLLDRLAAWLGDGLVGEAGRDAFVQRFQQLASPVMAKGVEDTALYRWSRLVSLNDVGSEPDHHGFDAAAFHEANRRRAAHWPHALLATSTHDNKRGEYVRMRINAISEDPAQWQALVERWTAAIDHELNIAGLLMRPARGDLYLLYQTLVGSAPTDPALLPATRRWPGAAAETVADYAERIKAYMRKAGREAKQRTSWTEPDDDYETAVARTIDLIFGAELLTRELLADIRPFAWWGGLNSLTATLLKLTSPGVPDIYQGARILDDSLVDPDNRRPVDFEERLPVIEDLARLATTDAATIATTLRQWLASGDFARLKLWLIQRLLHWRAVHAEIFAAGDYLPVPVAGPLARHLVAYVRRHGNRGLLVVATRLYRRLGIAAREYDPAQPPPSVWGDEYLDLGAAGLAGSDWRDLLATPDTAGPARATSDPPADPDPPDRLDATAAPAPLGQPDQAPAPVTRLAVAAVLEWLPVAAFAFTIADPPRAPHPSTPR